MCQHCTLSQASVHATIDRGAWLLQKPLNDPVRFLLVRRWDALAANVPMGCLTALRAVQCGVHEPPQDAGPVATLPLQQQACAVSRPISLGAFNMNTLYLSANSGSVACTASSCDRAHSRS